MVLKLTDKILFKIHDLKLCTRSLTYQPIHAGELTLNSCGSAFAGCPLTTNSREFKFRKELSKSSRDCSRNLQ